MANLDSTKIYGTLNVTKDTTIGTKITVGESQSNLGTYSSILGGANNNITTSRNYSTIAGGELNVISGGTHSVIGGGKSNTSSGYYWSTIGGGLSNNASGQYGSTVGGGDGNSASGYWGSTIAGGESNTSSGRYSSIGGGYGNTSSGYYGSTVGGGNSNTASGDYSSVLGGKLNNMIHNNSHAIGSSLTSAAIDTTYVQKLHTKITSTATNVHSVTVQNTSTGAAHIKMQNSEGSYSMGVDANVWAVVSGSDLHASNWLLAIDSSSVSTLVDFDVSGDISATGVIDGLDGTRKEITSGKTATYTISTLDVSKVVYITGGTFNVTMNQTVIAIGETVEIDNSGTGVITIVGGTNVVLKTNSVNTLTFDQYSRVAIQRMTSTDFRVFGELIPV